MNTSTSSTPIPLSRVYWYDYFAPISWVVIFSCIVILATHDFIVSFRHRRFVRSLSISHSRSPSPSPSSQLQSPPPPQHTLHTLHSPNSPGSLYSPPIHLHLRTKAAWTERLTREEHGEYGTQHNEFCCTYGRSPDPDTVRDGLWTFTYWTLIAFFSISEHLVHPAQLHNLLSLGALTD